MSFKKINHLILKAVWTSIQAVAKETQELTKTRKENVKAQKEAQIDFNGSSNRICEFPEVLGGGIN